jgi:hypothetical protein
MNALLSTETELRGAWISSDGRVSADAICKRIDLLVGTVLKFLACTPNGWQRLYQDLNDQRLWELSYPQSEMHGGGPPLLRNISLSEATQEFRFSLVV